MILVSKETKIIFFYQILTTVRHVLRLVKSGYDCQFTTSLKIRKRREQEVMKKSRKAAAPDFRKKIFSEIPEKKHGARRHRPSQTDREPFSKIKFCVGNVTVDWI